MKVRKAADLKATKSAKSVPHFTYPQFYRMCKYHRQTARGSQALRTVCTQFVNVPQKVWEIGAGSNQRVELMHTFWSSGISILLLFLFLVNGE